MILILGFILPLVTSGLAALHKAKNDHRTVLELSKTLYQMTLVDQSKDKTIQQKEAEKAELQKQVDELVKQKQSKADEAAKVATASQQPRGGSGGNSVGPVVFGNYYEWGQCTWFVASHISVPGDLGNANTWDDRAAWHGYTISYMPQVGSVAQTDFGFFGHVAIVIAIGDGQVELDEMNVNGVGVEDYRWVPTNGYKYIYF